MKNGLDEQYIDLLKDILENGVEKNTRNGKVLSVFGRSIRYKFKDGKFPLLTTKKMYWKGIVTELLWFLRGDTSIEYLLENDCNIWTGDAYKQYVKWVESPENQNNKNEIVKIPMSKENFIKTIKGDDEIVKKMGKKYCDEFTKKWGDLGPVYGKQWRRWDVPRMESKGFDFDTAFEKSQKIWESTDGMECGPSFETFCMSLLRSKNMGISYGYHTQVDQIQNLINDLKTNPDSRRLMVSAWNVGELDQMTLPPCHYGFQVYTRELSLEERRKLAKYDSEFVSPMTVESWDRNNIPTRAISLMFNMRSNDVPLGLPFNIASYALLLEIIGKMVNMVPDELIANLGDTHIYMNQVNGVKKQLTRKPFDLPKLVISNSVKFNGSVDDFLNSCEKDNFKLEDYNSHPPIKIPLSN